MPWQPGLYTVVAAVAAAAFAVLHVVGRQKATATASAFAWLMLSGLIWASSYGIQLGFTTRASQLFWQQVALITSSTVPPLLLLFVLRYADEGDRLTPRLRAVLAAEVIVFATLVLTNQAHHLVWMSAMLDARAARPVLNLAFASGYYLHIVYSYTVVTIALGILFTIVFRSASIYRRQASLLLLGAIPAFLAHIGYTLELSPIPGLDLTPFAFTFTGVLYGLALFHFDLLERTPVAQRRALDIVGDGLLVVDIKGLVVDANTIARHVYDLNSETSQFASATGYADPKAADGTTVSATLEGKRHIYDVHTSELDRKDEAAGHAVVLRDVTERNAYEQRLEVANRVFRHNLRNDLTVIKGNASLLEKSVDTPRQTRMAATIHETAEKLASLSEKLRKAVSLQRGQARTASIDPIGVLDELLTEFQEKYPAVTFKFEQSNQPAVSGLTERELSVAVRNLLENAVEHNENVKLTVSITVEQIASRTHIRVSDNGTGLPAIEQRVLESGSETPLEHSSGLGLWLTYWIVDAIGGDISVEISAGTTVTLELPAG